MKRKRLLAAVMAVVMASTLTMGMPMTGYAMDQGTETVASEPEAGTSSDTAVTNPAQGAESVAEESASTGESAGVGESQETKPDVASVAENKEAQNNTVGAAEENGAASAETVGAAETKTSGNFEYKVKDDGTVSITKYTGEEVNVTIPKIIDGKTVSEIGMYHEEDNTRRGAFSFHSSIQQITIPDSVISIGEDAFNSCRSLKKITIPDSVTSIGESAFNGCTSLQSVTIPDSVTTIEKDAFSCSALQSVTIPDSVTTIEEDAFSCCTVLQSVTIPDSVTSIGGGAFYNCNSLKSVTIPDSVTSIGWNAFMCCYSLQSVTIPDSVTSIGWNAFDSCNSLQSVTIPDSVTTIEKETFLNCTSLKSVTIPDSVTSIGEDAFSCYDLLGRHCSSLNAVYFYGDAPDIDSNAFFHDDSLTLYVLQNKSGWTVPQWHSWTTAYFTPESKPASTPTPVPTATPTPVPSQKVSSLPAGYNFLNDSYNFGNFDANISKKYFTTLFGSDKGNLLHKKYHKADGVCFGMAYTTAAIYNDYPNINTIVTRTGPFSSTICSKIRDINHTYIDPINYSGMYIGNHPITIEDYIKYAYIYQFSKKVSDSSIWYNNDTQFEAYKLLQLVKNTTDNNKINVTIGMMNHNTGKGHQVLAVGYDGNDILVDDPNYTKSLQRITVNNDGTWSFSGLNNWNSNTCYIRSNVDVQSPYLLLKSGQTTSSQEISSDSTKHTENYVEGMNIVDPDCNLVSISTDKFESDAKLTQVTNAEAIADHTSDGSNLYWTDNNVDKLTLSDLPNDNVEVEMAGNGSIISASAEKPDKIKLDTGNKLIALDTDQGSSCSISFKTCTESKDYKDTEVEVTVTGTSSSNNINVTQNDKGLAVSGIGEGTVTSSVDDKVIKSIEYNDNDGKITIAYDNTGDSDSLEVKADNTVTKKADSGKSQESREMYRLYNPNSGEHFYTSNQGERDHLVSLGWRYEGVAWNAPLTGAPIFRLYNPNAGDHHYTGSEKERDDLVKLGWKYEGVAWYTAPSTTKKPQYRLYNPNCTGAGAHHYTGSIKERDGLVKLGWRYEGIAWYGV